MASHIIKKIPHNTVEITVDVVWSDIKAEYDKAFSEILKEFTYTGFRKGKVPKSIAQNQIKKEAVYQGLLKNLLPPLYESIIKKENLKPVVNPKIELVKGKDNEDWQFKITVAEKPEIKLGEYKKDIHKLNLNQKKTDIWVPGKDKTAEKPANNPEKSNKNLNEILSILLKKVEIQISDLIVEEEINRRLSKLVDDIQKIGLTVEQYLKSNNTTIENLKTKFKEEIVNTYKVEFILSDIADKENIKVEQTDLDKLFLGIKDEKERVEARTNSYFYASILRKQKTLDFLTSL